MALLKPRAWAFAMPRSMHSRARARVSAPSGNLDPDFSGFDRHGIAGDPRTARGHGAFAGPQVVHPAVPGAGEAGAGETTLAQRTALVRALVAAREELVQEPGPHHPPALGPHPLQPGRRPILQACDTGPN